MEKEGPSMIDVCNFVKNQEKALNNVLSAEQLKEFDRLCSNIGRSIMKENGIKTKDESQKLPYEIVLGKESKKSFLELQLWVLKFN